MRTKASGFYADSLEMLLDTMCNVLGSIIFITLVLAVLAHHSSTPQVYQKQAAELTAELNALTSSNAVMEAELQRVVLQIQKSHQGLETNHMRLPNLARTTKQPWNIIIRYGRLYPVYKLSPDGRTEAERNTQTIDWRGAYVEPRQGMGEDAQVVMEEFARAFKRNSQNNFYLAFWVYEDSFDVFNRAKEAAVNSGMQYGWEPVARDAQLTVSGRGNGILPQN